MRPANLFNVPLAALLQKRQAEATLKQMRKVKSVKVLARMEVAGKIRN